MCRLKAVEAIKLDPELAWEQMKDLKIKIMALKQKVEFEHYHAVYYNKLANRYWIKNIKLKKELRDGTKN